MWDGRKDESGEMWGGEKREKVKTCGVGDVNTGKRGELAPTPSEPVW